MNVCILWGP